MSDNEDEIKGKELQNYIGSVDTFEESGNTQDDFGSTFEESGNVKGSI